MESPTSDWRPTLDTSHPSVKNAADAAAKFVSDMARGVSPYWLTFSGLQGVGKTFLAQQIHAQAIELNPGNPKRTPFWQAGAGLYDPRQRRPNAVWMHVSRLGRLMLEGGFDMPEELALDFCVVLDDLGATRDKNDFLADGLYRLADQRSHRWMVWTTNLTLAEISTRIDPRLSSRLIRDDNRLVTITAPDYALRKK